jgi:hypothetical protein
MTLRSFFGALGAMALLLLSARPTLGQALTLSLAPRPPATALETQYHVRLGSAWPQYRAASAGCENGGEEWLDGVLTAGLDGRYSGTFVRHTRLLFCGAHGPAVRRCELRLEGDGPVEMSGTVVADSASPSGRAVQVHWSPLPGHAVSTSGACPAAFMQSLKTMYLTARHGAELPLPAAGDKPEEERLADYAWIVEIR